MDNKAWDILTKEEKVSLNLSINHKKSSWEAGEILKKAHYKYLEIQARSKHFFRIFNEYFNKSGQSLIPHDSDMTWDFQEFILCTIQNRMGYRETLKYIGKESPLNHKRAVKRIEVLKGYMDWLKNHKDPLHNDLYDLIKEFDRWNNFRILPEELQEPSAFKRRNKTRLLKHLKNLKKIDPFLIERLIKNFTAKKNYNMKVRYLPVVSDNFPEGYQVLRIKASSKIMNYISDSLKLYVFKTKDEAEEYGILVEEHLNHPNKDCKKGQKFWPLYRKLIEKSVNYNEIQNIIPRRKNLEYAFRDLDKIHIKRTKKQDIDIEGEDRISDESLWKL